MGTPDEHAAASIQTNLSGYLMSGALAVLGADAAIAIFVLDKREGLGFFYLWTVLAWLALNGSLFVGGKGIADIYKSGHTGTWKARPDGGLFGIQASLCLVGVTCVFLSLFAGTAKPEKPTPPDNTAVMQSLRDEVQALRKTTEEDRNRLDALRRELEELRKVKLPEQKGGTEK